MLFLETAPAELDSALTVPKAMLAAEVVAVRFPVAVTALDSVVTHDMSLFQHSHESDVQRALMRLLVERRHRPKPVRCGTASTQRPGVRPTKVMIE